MKPKYNYDNVVKIRLNADPCLRSGERAWVVGIFETRPGPYFDKFSEGIVYTIEYEDGTSVEVHEMDLEEIYEV